MRARAALVELAYSLTKSILVLLSWYMRRRAPIPPSTPYAEVLLTSGYYPAPSYATVILWSPLSCLVLTLALSVLTPSFFCSALSVPSFFLPVSSRVVCLTHPYS